MIIQKIYNAYQQLKGGRLVEGIFNIGEYEQEREKIQVSPEERFFANVIGYNDIKKLLLMSLYNKEPLHILLT